jgi:PKD repeat protein
MIMKYLTSTLILLALLTSSVYASQNKAQVVVRIQAQTNGNIDQATLYFDQGINPVYVYQEDAQKVFSGVAGVPAIFSLSSDSVDCSINGYGSTSTTQEIALGYDVDADGMYDISTPVLDNVDPTSIIRLEDRTLGVFTDLRQGKYTAKLFASDSATGRFFVHISRPVQVTKANAGCSNNNGLIAVTQDNSVAWTSCTLLDAFNNQVGTYNNASGQFDFSGLAEGDYYMVYAYGSYTTTQSFHITGDYVLANIVASKQSVQVGEMIDFTAVATNSNRFNWDFGDGTLITGVANPSINYYEAGDYVVTLFCNNDHGCSDAAQINITVTAATVSGISENNKNKTSVYATGKSVTVNFSGTPADAQMSIYNLIGQPVYSSALTSQTEVASLENQPNGYYLVSVKNEGVLSTKRVFLSK